MREWIEVGGRARGDGNDGVYDVRVGDVGEVAPEREPADAVDTDCGRGGVTRPEFNVGGMALGGGVAGTPNEGATDLIFARLSSTRRVWHSCATCEYCDRCNCPTSEDGY